MAKKFNKDNIERIIALALEINGFEKERKAGSGIAVFCNISPHVQWIDIGIHLNGWKSGRYADECYTVRTREDKYADYDDAEKVIARLEQLLEQQRKFDKENAGC